MGDHVFGVDACVGSAGKSKGYRLTQDSREGVFKHLLDRDCIRLPLGAMKSRAVICKINEVAHAQSQGIDVTYMLRKDQSHL